MKRDSKQSRRIDEEPGEPLIAYVYGDTPPDLGSIAAFGFAVVCLDRGAPWFRESMVEEARRLGMMAVAFRMGRAA
jgi:hypothetical protein